MQVPINKAILTIKIYTSSHTTVYIDEDFNIATAQPPVKKLSNDKITEQFFIKVPKKDFETVTLEKWNKIRALLFTLTSTIKEQNYIDGKIQNCIEEGHPLTKVKALMTLHKSGRPLGVCNLRFLEASLIQIAAERISCIYLIISAFSEWHKYIIGDLYETMGGAIKRCDEKTNTIDWERSAKQSTEEFAISFRLEKARLENNGAYFPLLQALLEEAPDLKILHIWRTFFAFGELDLINDFYLKELVYTPGPVNSYIKDNTSSFFSREVKELFLASKAMAKDTTFAALSSCKEKKAYLKSKTKDILVHAHRYQLLEDDITRLYNSLYEVVEELKIAHKGYNPQDVSQLIGKKVPTIGAFTAMKLPSLSLELFEDAVVRDFEHYSKKVITEDASVTAQSFLQYLFGNQEQKNPLQDTLLTRICRGRHLKLPKQNHLSISSQAPQTVDEFKELASSFAKMYVSKPTRTKPVKKSKAATNHTRIQTPPPAKQDTHKNPTKRIREITVCATLDFTIAARVSSWHKSEFAEESTLLHTYPFLVTQIMRKYVAAEDFASPSTNKINRLYSRAGTIHVYGSGQDPIEGYFADCFDETTLYHHFFHKTPFSRLLQRYREKHPLVASDERDLIAYDSERLETILASPAETMVKGSLYDRFDLQIKHYSIEIDDIARKIRYTLCFPEWIQ